jgi:hypothetical protein
VRGKKSKRRADLLLAGAVLIVLSAVGFFIHPHDATSPIPDRAQEASESLEEGQGIQTGITGPAPERLAKQQQAARHANALVLKALERPPLRLPDAGWVQQAARYTQTVETGIARVATCEWVESCKPETLNKRSREQLILEVYVDATYGRTGDYEAAKKHASKVLRGKPTSAEAVRRYFQYTEEHGEGSRELVATTSFVYTVVRNGPLYVLSYTSLLFRNIAPFVILAAPFLLILFAWPQEKRRPILSAYIKVAVTVFAGAFVSLVLLTGYSWLSTLIPSWLSLLGMFRWFFGAGLLIAVTTVIIAVVIRCIRALWRQRKEIDHFMLGS